MRSFIILGSITLVILLYVFYERIYHDGWMGGFDKCQEITGVK